MKKLNQTLNIIMGSSAGIFIGHAIHVFTDFKRHPELYAMQSAPWYTSIVVWGAVTLAVLLVCGLIKVFIKRKSKNGGAPR